MARMEHIYKTFNKGTVNEVVLFSDFNLSIAKGDFVSVVGSNGSGKTTMLNILCGFTEVDSGKVYLNGRDITGLKEYKRAKFIGRVFQDPAKGTCPSLTILENMALADNKNKSFNLSPGINKKRVDYYRSQLELLKLGLEDKINLQVGSLSGGQRQALALLISTMTPIELLILDEHTAALDPRSSETVMELTQRVVSEKKITTLMVTHNLRYAVEYGNRLLMMHNGGCVIDKAGEEKQNVKVSDLLSVFNEISIECGN
ncbi:MAG TPA: ATP-binding cassette domain-containing protein [Clostridiales bacterium]|nr:ATP-binding cassette domain-containing protein [Clostridiales bacterium]